MPNLVKTDKPLLFWSFKRYMTNHLQKPPGSMAETHRML